MRACNWLSSLRRPCGDRFPDSLRGPSSCSCKCLSIGVKALQLLRGVVNLAAKLKAFAFKSFRRCSTFTAVSSHPGGRRTQLRSPFVIRPGDFQREILLRQTADSRLRSAKTTSCFSSSSTIDIPFPLVKNPKSSPLCPLRNHGVGELIGQRGANSSRDASSGSAPGQAIIPANACPAEPIA